MHAEGIAADEPWIRIQVALLKEAPVGIVKIGAGCQSQQHPDAGVGLGGFIPARVDAPAIAERPAPVYAAAADPVLKHFRGCRQKQGAHLCPSASRHVASPGIPDMQYLPRREAADRQGMGKQAAGSLAPAAGAGKKDSLVPGDPRCRKHLFHHLLRQVHVRKQDDPLPRGPGKRKQRFPALPRCGNGDLQVFLHPAHPRRNILLHLEMRSQLPVDLFDRDIFPPVPGRCRLLPRPVFRFPSQNAEPCPAPAGFCKDRVKLEEEILRPVKRPDQQGIKDIEADHRLIALRDLLFEIGKPAPVRRADTLEIVFSFDPGKIRRLPEFIQPAAALVVTGRTEVLLFQKVAPHPCKMCLPPVKEREVFLFCPLAFQEVPGKAEGELQIGDPGKVPVRRHDRGVCRRPAAAAVKIRVAQTAGRLPGKPEQDGGESNILRHDQMSFHLLPEGQSPADQRAAVDLIPDRMPGVAAQLLPEKALPDLLSRQHIETQGSLVQRIKIPLLPLFPDGPPDHHIRAALFCLFHQAAVKVKPDMVIAVYKADVFAAGAGKSPYPGREKALIRFPVQISHPGIGGHKAPRDLPDVSP